MSTWCWVACPYGKTSMAKRNTEKLRCIMFRGNKKFQEWVMIFQKWGSLLLLPFAVLLWDFWICHYIRRMLGAGKFAALTIWIEMLIFCNNEAKDCEQLSWPTMLTSATLSPPPPLFLSWVYWVCLTSNSESLLQSFPYCASPNLETSKS